MSRHALLVPTRADGTTQRSGVDGVTCLTVYAVLLFAIPSRLTVGPLGGAGSPAMVLGLLLGVLWACYQVQRPALAQVGSHPVRRAMLFVLVAFLVSYVLAMIHPIDPAETGTADLGMVALSSWAGVLFFAHDCVPTLERLLVLLRRLCTGGAAVAAVGILQFVTGNAIVDRINVPGLSENGSRNALTVREGFNRPFGTALHPIEFGSVLTILLPVAIAVALADTSRSLRRWLPSVLIAGGITVSVSRSAILGAVVGVVVLCAALPARIAGRIAGAASAMCIGVFLLVPGMLGTVLGLFTHAGADSSVESRTGSYALAGLFFERSPLFGRGFGTFLPSYRIFDNQYLQSLIEVGAVGLLALLTLFVSSAYAAAQTRRITASPDIAVVAQGLLASVWVGATGLAIFDGFSFPMGAGALFLMLGLSGSLYRLERRRTQTQAKRGR